MRGTNLKHYRLAITSLPIDVRKPGAVSLVWVDKFALIWEIGEIYLVMCGALRHNLRLLGQHEAIVRILVEFCDG